VGEVNWQTGRIAVCLKVTLYVTILSASHNTPHPILRTDKAVALNPNRIIITDPLSAAKSY